MSRRGLLTLAFLAALSIASLWWLRGAPDPGDSGEASRLLPGFDPRAASEVFLRSPRGSVRLDRAGEGWRLVEPEPDEADPERVDGLLGALEEARSLRVVAEARADLSPFGLDEPTAEVRIALVDGGSVGVRLGRASPVGFERYATVETGAPVVLVDGSLGTALERSAESFRQMRLVPIPPGAVRSIRIEGRGSALAISRQENGWRITEPILDRADEALADALARTVSALSLVTRGPGPPDGSSDVLRVRVEGEGTASGPFEVAVAPAENGDTVLGARIGSSVSGSLDRWVLEELSRPPDAYRDRRLARFSSPEVLELRFEGGNTAFAVRREREGAPWIAVGPGSAREPADGKAVERALDRLRGLRAASFLAAAPASAPTSRFALVGAEGILGRIEWGESGGTPWMRSTWRKGVVAVPEASTLDGLPERREDLVLGSGVAELPEDPS